jgi:hypothetical protein
VEDHCQGWRVAPSETRGDRAPLAVIFARPQDARREDGPVALADAVTKARDGRGPPSGGPGAGDYLVDAAGGERDLVVHPVQVAAAASGLLT